MNARITFALLVSVLLSPPAKAHWQYTQWGMTQEEVVGASGGKAVTVSVAERNTNSTKGADALLVAPYSSGQFEFQTFFLFDQRSHRLTQVRLQLGSRFRCDVLRQTLAQKYGEPITENIGRIIVIDSWRDETGGNKVDLVEEKDCTLLYAPLVEDDASGL